MSGHDILARVTSSKVGRAGLACTAGLGAVLVPGFAFAEGETTTGTVQTAITGMASSVADGALAMIAAIPALSLRLSWLQSSLLLLDIVWSSASPSSLSRAWLTSPRPFLSGPFASLCGRALFRASGAPPCAA